MPGKDPAALIYIANFLTATAEMRGDACGWFIRLLMHQYDKKSLPNDIEELASLALVRTSEFEVFQQVWQQVLQQKFTVLPTGRLYNAEADEIIRSRELFVDKRSSAGRISAFIKFIRKHLCQDERVISYIKKNVEVNKITTSDQQVLKQVFEHLLQLYINTDIDINKVRIEEDVGGVEGEEGGREGFLGRPPPEGTPWAEQGSGLPASMVDIFTQTFPDYPRQDGKDFSACLQIAYQIADQNGWPWQSAINGRMVDVLEKWKEIVVWIPDSTWFRTKSISFLNDKFQDLIQAKNNGTGKEHGGGNAKSGTSVARTEALRNWGDT